MVVHHGCPRFSDPEDPWYFVPEQQWESQLAPGLPSAEERMFNRTNSGRRVVEDVG